VRIPFDQTSNIHNYINPKNSIKFKIKKGFYTSLYMLMELRWGRGGSVVGAHGGMRMVEVAVGGGRQNGRNTAPRTAVNSK